MHVCVCHCWPVIQPQQKQRLPLILVPTDSAEPPLASLGRAKPNWTHLCCKPELLGEPKRAAPMRPAVFCWITTQTATLTTTKIPPQCEIHLTQTQTRHHFYTGKADCDVLTVWYMIRCPTYWCYNAGGFSRSCSNSGKFTSLLVKKTETSVASGYVGRR